MQLKSYPCWLALLATLPAQATTESTYLFAPATQTRIPAQGGRTSLLAISYQDFDFGRQSVSGYGMDAVWRWSGPGQIAYSMQTSLAGFEGRNASIRGAMAGFYWGPEFYPGSQRTTVLSGGFIAAASGIRAQQTGSTSDMRSGQIGLQAGIRQHIRLASAEIAPYALAGVVRHYSGIETSNDIGGYHYYSSSTRRTGTHHHTFGLAAYLLHCSVSAQQSRSQHNEITTFTLGWQF